MSFELPHTKRVFKHQPDAVLSQTDPVSGTWYTVLDTTKNVRVILADARVTWTVQPTPLEIRITIDGEVIPWSQADPESLADYFTVWIKQGYHDQLLAIATAPLSVAFLLEGRSVKVEARITGGTVSNLSARVKWAKME